MTATPDATPVPLRRVPVVKLALAVFGGVLLVLTVREVGWDAVGGSLRSVGWWFLAALALGGLRYGARARAWRVCASAPLPSKADQRDTEASAGVAPNPSPEPVASWPLFKAVIAGDALGNLTPLGLLASEPAKVYFVADRLTAVGAVSSVAAENAFYTATVFLMIGAGAAVFGASAGLPEALYWSALAVLGLVVLGGLVMLWTAHRRPRVLSWVGRRVTAWTGLEGPGRLDDIEQHLYGVISWPLQRTVQVLLWEGLFHVAAVTEVFVVLSALGPGRDVTLLDAFVLETFGRLVVVVFKFIPYRLGVDEAGTALVARALALDPAAGVALALIRRLRILTWNAAGLVVLTRTRS
ncbi:MAG: lysylphosphatidylglycerol synthase transmembrane domain-containing protein [Acidobacteriota bacterium]